MKTKKHTPIFTILIFILIATPILATVPSPATSGPSCWPPPCVPIDGGITALLIAGAALGIKKIYDSKKSSNTI